MGCCWHHCGPCWGPDQYSYRRETLMYRRRRFAADLQDDLRDYLEYLEGEIAVVRRELEELAIPDESTEEARI